jgi:hypothetical protein
MKLLITRDKNGIKHCISEGYNYRFDPKTGEFARWGKTYEDDPKVGMLEIFDLEVSTICEGIPRPGEDVAVPCTHCYKSNTRVGENMSFETFKQIFDKLPQTLTQIAFGIGDIWSNPDLVKMFDYCHNNDHNPGVIPNLTTNGWGLTDEWVATLAKYCGGIAVSRYANKDVCYDAVKKLTDAGIQQVNIHQVVSEEKYDQCMELINDVATDPRLAKLKAIVFLTLKPKGKRNKDNTIKDIAKYRHTIETAFSKGINIGFDSCSAPIFLASMKDHPQFKFFSQMTESCESNRFSGYANTKGEYWHCSFTEDQPGWKGINLLEVEDFVRDVWFSPEVKKFREALTCQNNEHIDKECYLCPVYDLYNADIGCAAKRKVIPIAQG